MNISPVIAICYDFDGTLSPGNMQEHGFLQELGMEPEEFWLKCEDFCRRRRVDRVLGYMRFMIEEAGARGIKITKAMLREFGSRIPLFPGMDSTWFMRISGLGYASGVEVRHYIISSGLREMIEASAWRAWSSAGSSTISLPRPISTGDDGSAEWPAMAVNYTGKTQFIFRISKGCENIDDDRTVNQLVSENIRTVPLSNMIYVGDGSTDIPCMRLIRNFGGRAVSVYDPSKTVARRLAHEIVSCGRADIAAPADYREGGILDSAVSRMVSSIIYNIELRTFARTECIREKQMKKRWQAEQQSDA